MVAYIASEKKITVQDSEHKSKIIAALANSSSDAQRIWSDKFICQSGHSGHQYI